MNKLLYLSALVIVFASCEKAQLNKETTTTEDNAMIESIFEDLSASVESNAAAINDTADLDTAATGACPTVTWSPEWNTWIGFWSFPKTVTVDFGTGCVGNDGKTRSGIVAGTFTNWPWLAGAKLTVAPDGYVVDGYGVSGTKSWTYNGLNSSGNQNWDIVVSNGQITTPENETINWESTRNHELIEGASDFNFWNNVYSITGTASGVNREGRSYDAEIIEALIVKAGCAHVTDGILEITPEDLKTRSIDYGDGTCDSKITVTIDGKTYDIGG